jgi:hypothetical protein
LATWGEVLNELNLSAQQTGGPPDFDAVRRRHLSALHAHTGRDTIVYATDWLMGGPPGIAITAEDMVALMEVCGGLGGEGPLDLILHSPGGSAEATASMVRYLRKQFNEVRVIVPYAAMSAATMLALSADAILMGKQSQLGPIDPQLVTPQGQIPARAILDQFERAKDECKADPAALGPWMPMLQGYGPALLEQCQNADRLAKRLVRPWLRAYMFKDEKLPARKAERVAKFFGDHHIHQSHSLGIDRDQAREKGVNVIDLEGDPQLEAAVLGVFYATLHTFSGMAIKIVENHLGTAYVRIAQQIPMPLQMQLPGPPQGMGPQPPGSMQ